MDFQTVEGILQALPFAPCISSTGNCPSSTHTHGIENETTREIGKKRFNKKI